MSDVLLTNAGVIAVLMAALWGLSVVLRDAPIVDPFWGLGFAVVAWTSAGTTGNLDTESLLLVALTTVTAVGPVLMSVLLLHVSGVALLERSLSRRKPGYDEYVRRTSAFFPRPPRHR